jgi:hypothetical protein
VLPGTPRPPNSKIPKLLLDTLREEDLQKRLVRTIPLGVECTIEWPLAEGERDASGPVRTRPTGEPRAPCLPKRLALLTQSMRLAQHTLIKGPTTSGERRRTTPMRGLHS